MPFNIVALQIPLYLMEFTPMRFLSISRGASRSFVLPTMIPQQGVNSSGSSGRMTSAASLLTERMVPQ